MTEDYNYERLRYDAHYRINIICRAPQVTFLLSRNVSYDNFCYLQFNSILFLNTIFVSSLMYPENPEGTQVIVGSKNMGNISDTARNRTHNLFLSKRELIPLGHSDGQFFSPVCVLATCRTKDYYYKFKINTVLVYS